MCSMEEVSSQSSYIAILNQNPIILFLVKEKYFPWQIVPLSLTQNENSVLLI